MYKRHEKTCKVLYTTYEEWSRDSWPMDIPGSMSLVWWDAEGSLLHTHRAPPPLGQPLGPDSPNSCQAGVKKLLGAQDELQGEKLWVHRMNSSTFHLALWPSRANIHPRPVANVERGPGPTTGTPRATCPPRAVLVWIPQLQGVQHADRSTRRCPGAHSHWPQRSPSRLLHSQHAAVELPSRHAGCSSLLSDLPFLL